jgi:hypothetical protein
MAVVEAYGVTADPEDMHAPVGTLPESGQKAGRWCALDHELAIWPNGFGHPGILRLRPGGEPVLQVDVPELVDRTCLPEHASPVGVGEEAHERPWEPVPQREPYPRSRRTARPSLR